MSAKDWEVCPQPAAQPRRSPSAPACVWPLAELGLVELMAGEHSITRELTALPTPGHTPGHVSLLITSRGERALVLGDAAHNPVQVHERSEEHTSELQSPCNLVCRLLLEKK